MCGNRKNSRVLLQMQVRGFFNDVLERLQGCFCVGDGCRRWYYQYHPGGANHGSLLSCLKANGHH